MSAAHTPSLRAYYLAEARSASWRAAAAMAFCGVAAVLATHLVLPLLPGRAIRFLEQAFLIRGMASVLVINDLLAVYFIAYFVGLAGLIEATVAAREGHRLEILLAKPVAARTLLGARVGPILALAAAAGCVVAATAAAAVGPWITPRDTVSTAGALGGGLCLASLAVVILAALLPLLVRMRESFHALLIASVAWMVTVMPAAVLIYRPDLFETRRAARDVLVFVTLVWHDGTAAWLGPVSLVVAAAFSAAMAAVAGRVLEGTDVG